MLKTSGFTHLWSIFNQKRLESLMDCPFFTKNAWNHSWIAHFLPKTSGLTHYIHFLTNFAKNLIFSEKVHGAAIFNQKRLVKLMDSHFFYQKRLVSLMFSSFLTKNVCFTHDIPFLDFWVEWYPPPYKRNIPGLSGTPPL